MGGRSAPDRVADGIDRLDERFGPFPVNQTTMTLSGDDYRAVRDGAEPDDVVAYVRVSNDADEVLHLDGDGPALPRCTASVNDPLRDRVSRSVEGATGVACELRGVARVTIAGVRPGDADDDRTTYRLVALVDAEHVGGSPTEGEWKAGEPVVPEHV